MKFHSQKSLKLVCERKELLFSSKGFTNSVAKRIKVAFKVFSKSKKSRNGSRYADFLEYGTMPNPAKAYWLRSWFRSANPGICNSPLYPLRYTHSCLDVFGTGSIGLIARKAERGLSQFCNPDQATLFFEDIAVYPKNWGHRRRNLLM